MFHAASMRRVRGTVRLRAEVEATLTDAKVCRVGERTVQVYVLGKTKRGTIGGLRTTSVET